MDRGRRFRGTTSGMPTPHSGGLVKCFRTLALYRAHPSQPTRKPFGVPLRSRIH